MTDNQKKLMGILRDMFQFDQADLDFGIYRIMCMKRDEVSRFIEEDLPVQITEGLQELAGLDTAADIAAIDKQIADTKTAPLSDAIKTAAVAELEEKKKALAGSVDITSVEADVYNHLTNFFSRYYDEGDFISQRRYKDGAYAIPYEGEEVKLHWANADQYYVKTSEYFKGYTFKTKYGDIIRFKLVEADTEKDNNKANEKRFFQLHTERPFEVVDGALVIYVEYKNGGKKNQAECISEIVAAFSAASAQYRDYSTILTASDGKTILERQLNRYTARNTFDYFIHKDLGKFLNRELDFYIKNDVIFLDDIDERDEAKTKEYLTKAKVIRKIARKIVTFLAQIEDFQKKLYLKKKFVVETNYCITLDRVPEKLYPEIAANDDQRKEWMRLFAIDEIEDDLTTPAYSVPVTVDFLKANPFLVLDTAFFSAEFKEKLIDSIDGLDDKLDGLMIHSENSQALRLLQGKYTDRIRCIYIDPPYNTSASEILYKNNYKHSSWLTMMEGRIAPSLALLSEEGVLEIAIDDAEGYRLQGSLEALLGDANHIANIAILSNPKGREQAFVSDSHEYTYLYAKNINRVKVNRLPLSDEELSQKYPKSDSFGSYRTLPLRRRGTDPFREDRPYMFFPFIVDSNGAISLIPRDECSKIFNGMQFDDAYVNEINESYAKEDKRLIWPIREDGSLGRWRWGYDRCQAACEQEIFFLTGTREDTLTIYHKDYSNDTVLPKSLWFSNRYDASTKGTNILKSIIPNNPFDYPKSIFAVEDFIHIGADKDSFVLDYFAGSGTTAHAVINLNRADSGERKYVLVEMGDHFESVIRPRTERIIYSFDWKAGKPVSRIGSSHAFKYLQLESYEDALNNIVLRGGEYDMLGAAKEGYLLSYMLDTESVGSDSLLKVEKLDKPFSYVMNITRNLESTERTIDLVETFNYLIGLTVGHSHALDAFDADFATGEYGALTASLKDGGTYKFKAVDGTLPNGDKALVLWREMTGDTAKDNAALDAYFLSLTNARRYRRIYVNCDNNLMNLRANGENWRVVLIDEEMKKRMFDTAE